MRALVVGGAAVAVLTGCIPQSAREEAPVLSAEAAAGQAVMVEPGPPPPDLAAPTDAVILERLRKRAAERQAAGARLRMDTGSDRHQDVWARIRSGMGLPQPEHPSIDAELKWYAERPDYIQRTTDRARLYLAYIVNEAQRRDLPLELALLPVVESAFQPFAQSPAGAMGIWQFIRSTGQVYGLRQSPWYDGRRDIVEATRAAFDYLEKLNADMQGDWLLAVAAYNAGEGNVLRAIQRNRARGQPTDFFSLQLPAETRAYVPRLLAVARLVARPGDFGITLDPIDDEPYFRVVDVGGQIDLAKAAEMAGVSLNELLLLNPAYMRHATDPDPPHDLLVPADSVTAFQTANAALGQQDRLAWSLHEVARGDTLSAIAKRYGVSVESLRSANEMQGNLLSVGQDLKVPAAPRPQALAALSPEVRNGITLAQRNAQQRVYRVRPGDNLWLIARRQGVSVAALMGWNGLGKNSVLQPGQKLVIRSSGTGTERASDSTPAPKRPHMHVVRSGENLWAIARRYQISAQDLAQWNGIDSGDTLHPGQQLRLTPPHSATVPVGTARG